MSYVYLCCVNPWNGSVSSRGENRIPHKFHNQNSAPLALRHQEASKHCIGDWVSQETASPFHQTSLTSTPELLGAVDLHISIALSPTPTVWSSQTTLSLWKYAIAAAANNFVSKSCLVALLCVELCLYVLPVKTQMYENINLGMRQKICVAGDNNCKISADCTVMCTVHLLYKMIQNFLKVSIRSAYEWISTVLVARLVRSAS